MTKLKLLTITLLLLGVIAATSCSDRGPSIESLNDKAPAGATYTSTEQIRDALNQGGLQCTFFNKEEATPLTQEKSTCSVELDGVPQVLTFNLWTEQQVSMGVMEKFNRTYLEEINNFGKGLLLSGPNWTITGSIKAVKAAQEEIGGTLRKD